MKLNLFGLSKAEQENILRYAVRDVVVLPEVNSFRFSTVTSFNNPRNIPEIGTLSINVANSAPPVDIHLVDVKPEGYEWL